MAPPDPDDPGAPAPGSPEHRAATTPEEPCLSDEAGRSLTWGGLNALADGLAATLHDEHEVRAAGGVPVVPEPGVELFGVLLALAKLGANAVLVPPGTDPPGAVVSPRELQPAAGAPPRFTGSAPAPPAVAFTAGRTGPRRAVVRRLGPGRTAAAARTLADLIGRVGLRAGHAHLLTGPPERSGPLFWAQLVLALGGRVHVASGAPPEVALQRVEEHEIASVFLSPPTLEDLGALPGAVGESVDTTSVAAVLTGDGPLTPAGRAAAEDLFGYDVVRDVYATTETGPVALDGDVLAGVEVEARSGELWVRSPLLADGYLDDPAATAAAFRDGWFATGDRGEAAGGILRLSG